LLIPFIPLSNRFMQIAPLLFCSRGGENMRGGEAPSLLNSPLQPIITPVRMINRMERGQG
jgi:hypothetical protein